MARQWTTKQLETLRQHANSGVINVQHELKLIGVERSIYAIQIQASRLGISLASSELCPRCGKRVKSLGKTGWCKTCDLRTRTEAIRKQCAQIEREIQVSETSARREYNAEKQRLYRLRKKQNDKK